MKAAGFFKTGETVDGKLYVLAFAQADLNAPPITLVTNWTSVLPRE